MLPPRSSEVMRTPRTQVRSVWLGERECVAPWFHTWEEWRRASRCRRQGGRGKRGGGRARTRAGAARRAYLAHIICGNRKTANSTWEERAGTASDAAEQKWATERRGHNGEAVRRGRPEAATDQCVHHHHRALTCVCVCACVSENVLLSAGTRTAASIDVGSEEKNTHGGQNSRWQK